MCFMSFWKQYFLPAMKVWARRWLRTLLLFGSGVVSEAATSHGVLPSLSTLFKLSYSKPCVRQSAFTSAKEVWPGLRHQ